MESIFYDSISTNTLKQKNKGTHVPTKWPITVRVDVGFAIKECG